jgi:hypothetical protein
MSMATVKELINKLGSLKQTARVYELLKSFLEGHIQVDETEPKKPMKMGDGTEIDEEILYIVLADLDEFGLGPIVEEIEGIEKAEVANERKRKAKKEEWKPKPKAKAKRKK